MGILPGSISDEAVATLACDLALTSMPELLQWVTTSPEAPELVDQTIAELGLPEPDLDAEGRPVAGSVLRKLFYWSNVEAVRRALLNYAPSAALAPAGI